MKKYMKDAQVKCMNSLALKQWHAENEENTYQSQQMLKLQLKLRGCHSRITLKNGKTVRTACRCAICPRCSRNSIITQSLRIVKSLDNSDKQNCRFMTVIVGLTTDIETVYCMFDAFRTKLRKDVNNRRDRKDMTARLWRQVSLEGNMEIDSLMTADWDNLGSKKKHQYEKLLGYNSPEGRNVPVYVVTAHILLFKGRLSLKNVEEIVKKQDVVVHFEKLWENQNLPTAVGNCLGYSVKVNYKTELENYTSRLWNFEQIQALMGLISRSRGRCGWKLSVKQRKRS